MKLSIDEQVINALSITLIQYYLQAVQGRFIRKEGDTFIVKLNHVEGRDELSKLLEAGLVRTKGGGGGGGVSRGSDGVGNTLPSRGPPLLTTVSNKR